MVCHDIVKLTVMSFVMSSCFVWAIGDQLTDRRPAEEMQRPPSASARKVKKTSSRHGSAPPAAPGAAESSPAAVPATAGPERSLAPLRAVPVAGRSLEALLTEEVYMDQIIHKLQLLSYEREFCRKKKPHRKLLSVTTFTAAQPGQGGNEQFFYFTSLSAWLLQLCGVAVPMPKDFDDPNTTLQTLLQGLAALGFALPSYPPSKLGQGWGREVCCLVDGLLDVVLERRGPATLGRPCYQLDRVEDDVVDEADDETDTADIATQAGALQTEESEEEAALVLGRSSVLRASANTLAAAAEAAAVKQALVSTIDPMQWKLEAERVAPRLRLTLAADMQDWRQHLEAAHGHAGLLASAWPELKAALARLSGELLSSLDKVELREQQLNSQFEGLMLQYQAARVGLAQAQEEYHRRTEVISERNNELHRLVASLEDAKQQLDSRGSNLSDASPLVRLKAALTGLRGELRGMELRIGVVAHSLMSLSQRDKQAALQDAARRQAAAGSAHGRDASGGARGVVMSKA